MTNKIEAIYEKGVFKPVEPVTLAEGARVQIAYETPVSALNGPELAAALDAIAALPIEGPDDGFSGADADRILYGGGDAQ